MMPVFEFIDALQSQQNVEKRNKTKVNSLVAETKFNPITYS